MSMSMSDTKFAEKFPTEAKLVRYCFLVSFTALGIGGLMGLIQALHRTDYFRILPIG